MADFTKPPNQLPASANARAWFSPFYEQAGAAKWGLSLDSFHSALARCLGKALPASADSGAITSFLGTLHLEDLVLACACAEGSEAAWEHFVAVYRGYLRSAAAVILRCASGSPQAVDLADSLFAELYGIADGKPGHGSLFAYFHGRSSLKTWLRAVLAQRHIDRIRATSRFIDLEDGDASSVIERKAAAKADPPDPHRDRYLRMLRRALHSALGALDSRDAQRLALYYRENRTLAEIGRLLGEHESSVSRNLERVRRSLRSSVESMLRAGVAVSNGSPAEPGLSDAQIALCFEYAADDGSMSLDSLLPPMTPSAESTKPESAPPRKRL
jgi:RNA polymerase sigma-70 factor, ECF subfamily